MFYKFTIDDLTFYSVDKNKNLNYLCKKLIDFNLLTSSVINNFESKIYNHDNKLLKVNDFVFFKYTYKSIIKNDYFIFLINNTEKSIKINYYYKRCYIYIFNAWEFKLGNRYIDIKNFFTSDTFEQYLNNTKEVKQTLWKLTSSQYCKQGLFEKIMNNIVILDIETISLKESGQDTECEQIYSIGILEINSKTFLKILENNYSIEDLYTIYYKVKYMNLFQNSEMNNIGKNIKILYFYGQKSKQIALNIKIIMDLVLKNVASDRYIYTFNGKNFDFYIFIQLLIKHIPHGYVSDLVQTNNMIYSFTFNFIDDFGNKVCQKLNNDTTLYKQLSESEKKYYRYLTSTPTLLNKRLHFRDITTIMLNMSLKTAYKTLVQENFNLQKEDFDIVQFMEKVKKKENISQDNKDCDKYLISDLFSLYHIIYLLFDTIVNDFKINPLQYFTVASISMLLFRRYVEENKHKIYIIEDNYINSIIYQTILGGRVYCNKPFFNFCWNKSLKNYEMFKKPKIKKIVNKIVKDTRFSKTKKRQLIYELDVNSLYPAAMMLYEYPIGKMKFVVIDINNYKSFIKKRSFFIATVQFKVPRDHKLLETPVRTFENKHKKSYMNVKETVEDTFTSVDILNKIKLGYIVTKISGGIIWEKTAKIFAKHIESLYDARINKNIVYKTLSKAIMNSLYGKFAQKPIEKTISIINKRNLETFLAKRKILKSDIRLYEIKRTHCIVEVNRSKIQYKYSVQIASAILSYSRLIMNNYISIIDGFRKVNFYYSDTDSIYVEQQERQKLLKFISNKIGMLKEQNIISSAIFIGNKMKALKLVCGKEIVTFKGFRHITYKDCYIIFLKMLVANYLDKETISAISLLGIKYSKATNIEDQLISFKKDFDYINITFKKSFEYGIKISSTYKNQNVFGPVGMKLCIKKNTYINID